MSPKAALRRALESAPARDATTLFNLALDGIDAGLEEDVRDCLEARIGPDGGDARLWQALGLALRGLGDGGGASRAFARAAALRPDDALIAHSHARTTMEAGRPARALFERAARLAPADGSVLLGRAAAQLAEGDGEGALAGLEAILAANPGWIEGHQTFVALQAMLDPKANHMRTLERAIAAHRQQAELWFALARAHNAGNDYAGGLAVLEAMEPVFGTRSDIEVARAICLTELDRAEEAQPIFARQPPPQSGEEALWPIRNLIRLGRFDEAMRVAERSYPVADYSIWPYRALLWRWTGDPRWEWLEGDERLVRGYDVSAAVGDMNALAEHLRSLHFGVAQPLEQSVRGGTQTDGVLFMRDEPEIRKLRAAIIEAVREHIAQLPPRDSGHPTLAPVRDAPVRFAGSWSVRLTGSGGGHHSDHVHMQGWFSSALYIAVPRSVATGSDEAGALVLGECSALLPDFAGFRTVRPRVGTLTLFPSTMWHGTRPYAEGERMTVAFDVAMPRGDA